MKKIIYISLLFLLAGCHPSPELSLTIHECAPIPKGHVCTTCFVVGDQAYFFAGRDSAGRSLNDLWRYTPATDTWDNLGATPLTKRVNATACVCGDSVYIGLGFLGSYFNDSSYMRDWWQYVPATNQWTRLASYPNNYTDRATSFRGDGELYVGYGFSWQYRRDMFRYSIAENRWDSIDVGVGFHGYPARSFGGTGCTCQHRHFMGTGYYGNSLNWWAEFMPEGRWVARTAVPGRTRTLAASAATDKYIWLCGGMHYGGVNTNGEVLQDIYRYNPETDQWTFAAVMPQRLLNHVMFTVGNRVYFGLGETQDWEANNKLYYFEE